MNTCRPAKPGQVGETSSKYGMPNGAELFEADLKAAEDRYNFLWNEFVGFMKSHEVDPRELRSMFTRYYEEFLEG